MSNFRTKSIYLTQLWSPDEMKRDEAGFSTEPQSESSVDAEARRMKMVGSRFLILKTVGFTPSTNMELKK